jgi:hypothetical protein
MAAAAADLVAAERLAAIGQLSVTLHHEINNPLMSASVEVELMLEKTTDEQTRCSLESVRLSLERIRDVLTRVGELHEARTRPYIGDVGMIDINQSPAPLSRQGERGDALVWMVDDDLVRVITLLLKHAGCTVRRVEDSASLEQESTKLGVSLVVIGQPAHGVPTLGGFRPGADKGYTLVALVEGDGAAERERGADHTVALPFDPGSFTEEVLRAMELNDQEFRRSR